MDISQVAGAAGLLAARSPAALASALGCKERRSIVQLLQLPWSASGTQMGSHVFMSTPSPLKGTQKRFERYVQAVENGRYRVVFLKPPVMLRCSLLSRLNKQTPSETKWRCNLGPDLLESCYCQRS